MKWSPETRTDSDELPVPAEVVVVVPELLEPVLVDVEPLLDVLPELVDVVDPVVVVPVDDVVPVEEPLVVEVPVVEAMLVLTVKSAAVNTACCGLSSTTKPAAASLGTVTVAWVSLTTFTAASWAVPIHALLSPVNPVPVRVMVLPMAPLVGEKDEIDG